MVNTSSDVRKILEIFRTLGSEAQIARLEDALGRPELTEDDVEELRSLITACGALRSTEELIDGLSREDKA